MPLFVVATPIGNLDDVTRRAVQTLRDADVIYAEDTRHSRPLLLSLGVEAPVRSYHEHSDEVRVSEVVDAVASGRRVALITDAGTPGISDPGQRVVAAARDRGLEVVPIPGPSAVVAFLSASGLPTDTFLFVGFAPRRDTAREKLFGSWAELPHTVVLYESPNRVLDTLGALHRALPGRRVCVGRELTKRYESFVQGTADEVARTLTETDAVRGEFVIGISPAAAVARDADEESEALRSWVSDLAATSARPGEIASLLSRRFRVSEKDVYNQVLRIRRGD